MAPSIENWVPAHVNERHIHLRIEHCFNDKTLPRDDTMSVEVVYTFPDTTSPVKLVQFINRGITVRAVLKLYDRTHPGRIHAIDYVSYDRENAGYPHFVQARFEAGIWYEFDRRHKTELRAYQQLQSMQGKKIPRLYANVRLSLSSIDKTCKGTPEEEEFLSIPGLLLQYCECRKLSELRTPGMAHVESYALPVNWTGMAQRTLNAIHEINSLGIVLTSYNNNAIFRRENGNNEPYIIDFAEALFKEDLIESWIKAHRERSGLAATEYPHWRREVGFWEMAKVYRNPQSIAEAFFIQFSGCELPDYSNIIEEIRLLALREESQNIQTLGE